MNETRIIRLLWDFRGMDAQGTADHHKIHLEEFAIKHQLPYYNTGVQTISEMYVTAYIDVDEPNMLLVRDALIPHRGELVEE